MEQTSIERQKISEMQFDHFAIIVSNLSLAGMLLILSTIGLSFLSIFFYLVYFLIVLALTLVTFFTILINNPNIFNVENGGIINAIIDGLVVAMPYLSIATIAFSALSTVLLLSQKNKKHKTRLVFSIIALVIGILAVVASNMSIINVKAVF